MKYVIKNRRTNMFLSKSFYKDNKQSINIKDAYKFSAFELLLASRTILREREKYIVYQYENGKNLWEELM